MVWGVRRGLIGVLGLGALVALILAVVTDGDPFDMESYVLVAQAMDGGVLRPYDVFGDQIRWPYPPAYFPVIHVTDWFADRGVASFELLIRLLPIAATAAIAWLVQDHLREAGESDRVRLAAAALVSLGPSFFVIAGYHGQFDAVAILPAVIAVRVWVRDTGRRALIAGLLIGVGGALKTIPLLMVLALLPSVRSWREAVTLMGAAATPVVVAFLPFALAGTLPEPDVLTYRGVPGAGSLSLLVQPEIAAAVLGTDEVGFSSLSRFVADKSAVFIAIALLLVAAIGLRTRASAVPMAVLLWLAVYTFGVNFFFQYAIWGLPFMLMAGYVRYVLAVQAALLVPMLLFYMRPWDHTALAVVYAGLMVIVWASACGGFAALARSLLRRAPARGAPA